MSLEAIEKLKRDWTDQYVVVDESVPELRRFAGQTGIVKTVNMNGHALVEFRSRCNPPYPDISWYDISPAYLRMVDQPVEPAEEKKPAGKPAAAKPEKAAPGKSGKKAKKSPLELAREQDAGGSQQTAGAQSSGKKPSPLELARQQDAGGKSDSQPEPAQNRSEPDDGAAPSGKKPSPLELARQQGAAKRGADSQEDSQSDRKAETVSTASTTTAEQAESEAETGKPPSANKTETPTGPGGRPLSKLELARMQGPAKRNE